MPTKSRVPSYCHHKPTNQAYVRFAGGRPIYLGAYGSPASRAEYDRLIAEYLARGRTSPAESRGSRGEESGPSVNEVLLGFYRAAKEEAPPDSAQPEKILLAIGTVQDLYGLTPAAEFSPLKLVAVRDEMIRANLARNTITMRLGIIRRAFRWAAIRELVPASVATALELKEQLREGRPGLKPSKVVTPVNPADVEAALPFLPPILQAMVKVQRWTGMRSGELVRMTTGDIDRSGTVWRYIPEKHKNAHRGHTRVVPLGPKLQELLTPYLREAEPTAFIFSPAIARDERNAAKRAKRKTRVQPSQVNRRKGRPRKAPGVRYTSRSYRRAILFAIEAAKRAKVLPEDAHWHPHQLRHTRGTEVRKQHGLDVARAVLGHKSIVQTNDYAELDHALAESVAV